MKNKKKENPKVSKYKGVSWDTNSQKWLSQVAENKTVHQCGYFKDDREAAKARDLKILRLGLKKPLQILTPVRS